MKRITSYVLKVASRCNLNCSYCYMYNLGDKTYLKQPKVMSLNTVREFARRLENYRKAAGIKYVQIVFHGGEPLLLDSKYFRECITIFQTTCKKLEFSFSVQTNGVTLDERWYRFFSEFKVRVGVSIDGPKQHHDKFRVFHNGKGSYDQVAQAIKSGKGRGLVGVLSVVSPHIPANEYYSEMKALEIESLNLLFPDGHYDMLPEGFDPGLFNETYHTPYADWLIQLFFLWKHDKNRPTIRLFENLIEMLIGEEHIGDQVFGKKKNGVAVVETDGGIEVVDSMRACYEGITRNSVNVHSNHIEDIFEDKVFDLYYNAHHEVCEQCLNCPVYEFCGGGFIVNRYANKNGFDNPTIYCKDIIRLLTFLQNDILEDLPSSVKDKLQLEKITYEAVLQELQKQPAVRIDSVTKQKLNSFRQSVDKCT